MKRMLRLHLLAGFLGVIFASGMGFSAERAVPGAELFADRAVRTFKIEISGGEFEALKKENRQYVRGTIKEGTNIFTNVAVHLKGMGSFRPLHEKPSFAVRFDKFVPGQTYCGMSKFLLNNSSQDGSYLAEYMSTSLFRDAGLPAARVTHAFVELNGRDLGLYVLIEAMNKDFLRQHFRSARGHLYEAYTQDIDQQLDQDGGKPTDQTDRKALADATRIADPARRWTELGKVLDVDEFISFVPFPGAGAGAKPFKVLLASPRQAFEILERENAAGRGDARPGLATAPLPKVSTLIGTYKGSNVTAADSFQSTIDAVKAVMKTKFNLADADFIEIPVFFKKLAAVCAKAFLPDMVNLLVVNGHLIAPDPFYDPFKADFDDKLAAIGYKKSSDANPTIHFVDDFRPYHEQSGEVHCGTNSRREIPDTPNWWEQR